MVCVTCEYDEISAHDMINYGTCFFVYYHVYLYPLFRLALEETINAPFWVVGRRTAKVELRCKPPVLLAPS